MHRKYFKDNLLDTINITTDDNQKNGDESADENKDKEDHEKTLQNEHKKTQKSLFKYGTGSSQIFTTFSPVKTSKPISGFENSINDGKVLKSSLTKKFDNTRMIYSYNKRLLLSKK